MTKVGKYRFIVNFRISLRSTELRFLVTFLLTLSILLKSFGEKCLHQDVFAIFMDFFGLFQKQFGNVSAILGEFHSGSSKIDASSY